MNTSQKTKLLYELAKTYHALLPYKPFEQNSFPENQKENIELTIRKNAARREELINKENTRPFLDISNCDVNIDISPMRAGDIVFTSHTNFSNAVLPKDFNPSLFIEKGKNAGQGIKELHKNGITGKGIKIAIIDEGLPDHREYHDNIKHYEQFGDFSCGSFHGAGVTSLAVGTNCGIAPDAEVYYFAVSSNSSNRKELTVGTIPLAIQRCIEINRLLPEKEKITAISCSQACQPTMDGYEDFEKMRKLAEQEGIEFISVLLFKEKGLSYNGYNRDLNKDMDSPDNILPLETKYIDHRVKPDWFSCDDKKTLLFPVEHRTAALNTGYDDYKHYALGGYSWIIPQITATFALAKQAHPECTLEHMWQTGLKTGIYRTDLHGVALQPPKMIAELQREYALCQRKMHSLNQDISFVFNKSSQRNF